MAVKHEEPMIQRIRPPTRIGNLNGREIWRARETLYVLGRREITLRYRQTVVGVAWVVVGPLLSAGVFSFVFGRVAKLPTDGVPYFMFSYGGLLAWTLFNSTLSQASNSLLGNQSLVSKIYFPRIIIPFSAAMGTLVNFAVGWMMLIVILVGGGYGVRASMVLLPLWLLPFLLLSLGIGLLMSGLAVLYRDVSYVVSLFNSLLLYLSPIAYSASAVPGKYRTLYSLNPLVGLLEGFRGSVFGTAGASGAVMAYSVVMSALVFAVGIAVFSRIEPRVVDDA
jgi:lipopolysaccharide transport system permease protein